MLWFNQSVLHYPGRCSVPRYLARPAPRFYSKVSNLALVSKISSANSYLISSNPESPAQLNFLLTILFWLIWSWERSGLEGSLRLRLPLLLPLAAAALVLHCCCNAKALAAVAPTVPGRSSRRFSIQTQVVLCSNLLCLCSAPKRFAQQYPIRKCPDIHTALAIRRSSPKGIQDASRQRLSTSRLVCAWAARPPAD